MIAANEAVAGAARGRAGCRRSTASTSGPTARASQRLADQLASLDVPTPPLPETADAAAGGATPSARSRGWSPRTCARTGHGARGADLARAALAQAGALLAGEPRPRRPALAALLPLHVADPPLPRPRRATARCWRRSAPGRSRRRRRRWRSSASGARTRERDAMAIERDADDVARCFLLERELFERGWEHGVAGEVIGVIGAGRVRRASATATRACCRCAACAATGGSSTSSRRCWSARGSGEAIRLGDPVDGAGRARRRAARPRRPVARRAVLSRMAKGSKRKAAPATSPPTGRPPTATTCSRSSRRAWC